MREYLTLSAKEQQRSGVVSRWLAGIITTAEAVALLGCSERTAWRLRAAMVGSGAAGLAHGNRGRASPRRLSDADRDRILELARTEYQGYNDTHLAEALGEDEGIVISRPALRRLLRASGMPSPRTRRAPRYRSRRERMAQAGLLVQVDGSRHDWLEGRGPWLTLVGGIDDATGVIVGAVFREHEDGVGYLTMVRDMARRYGLPAALYRDGSSVFAPTGPDGPGRDEATQVGRALAELGIGERDRQPALIGVGREEIDVHRQHGAGQLLLEPWDVDAEQLGQVACALGESTERTLLGLAQAAGHAHLTRRR